MAAVDRDLVQRGSGLALLFAPPFDRTTLDPGYIKGYPPGIRENGGQYTHAAVWAVIAFAMLGQAAKALELFFTADFVDGVEAERIGLVNHVYDDDKLMEETYKLAARLADSPPINMTLIKRTIYQSLTTDLRTSLDLGSSHMAVVRSTEDSKEAIKAFKEKRKGNYKNR